MKNCSGIREANVTSINEINKNLKIKGIWNIFLNFALPKEQKKKVKNINKIIELFKENPKKK
mgnify:CR=1 FL=1